VILKLEYRESCVAKAQLFFCKANWQSCLQFTAGSWTSGVDFSVSAEGGNFAFWPWGYRGFLLSSALYTSLK